MFQIVDIVGTILSLIGVLLIIKKKWQGYVIWCFSNICWVIIGIYSESWGQVFTFGILFMVANIYGIYEWRFKKPKTIILTPEGATIITGEMSEYYFR